MTTKSADAPLEGEKVGGSFDTLRAREMRELDRDPELFFKRFFNKTAQPSESEPTKA